MIVETIQNKILLKNSAKYAEVEKSKVQYPQSVFEMVIRSLKMTIFSISVHLCSRSWWLWKKSCSTTQLDLDNDVTFPIDVQLDPLGPRARPQWPLGM